MASPPKSPPGASAFPPRFIRMSQAPAYLGMCRRVFNQEARPHLTEVRIGKQGIAFDREELDRFAEQYKETHAIRKPASEVSAQPSRKPGTSGFEKALAAIREQRKKHR